MFRSRHSTKSLCHLTRRCPWHLSPNIGQGQATRRYPWPTHDKHVNEICRSAYFHTRALRHVRKAISDDTAKTVAQALVSSRFDYANSILYGAPKYNISKLQRAQNVLARVVTRSHRRTSADALLHKLHWLPIEDRIVFKLALLAYKTLLLGSSSYLSTLLTIYRPPRTLRSSNSNLLCATRTKTFTGSRAFRCAAPAIWNSLPDDIKSSCSIESFRTKLKTFLFRQSCT